MVVFMGKIGHGDYTIVMISMSCLRYKYCIRCKIMGKFMFCCINSVAKRIDRIRMIPLLDFIHSFFAIIHCKFLYISAF